MKRTYCHLKEKDRLRLYALLLEGESIQAIAGDLGVHKSTIYRELSRNSSGIGYRPDLASHQYLARRRYRPTKIESDQELESTIVEKLKEGWSPEQIAGRLKRDHGKQVLLGLSKVEEKQ